MTKVSPRKIKGSLAALSVAFLQGFEGLLYPLFGFVFSLGVFQSIGFSTASLGLKEIIAFVFVFMMVGFKRTKEVIVSVVKNREKRLYLYAGLFGTTFGNLFYIMAIQFAGSAYGVILTSLYPVFSMFLVNVFMKEKEKPVVWLGVGVAVVGGIMFTMLPSIILQQEFTAKKIAGIVLGAVAAFMWALEGMLLNKAVKHKENKSMSSLDSVLVRSLGSALMTLVFLMPLTDVVNSISHSNRVDSAFRIFIKILASWQAMLIMFSIAINLVILRRLHMYAVMTVGAKMAAIIDTNNFLVPPLFSIFLHYGYWTFVGSSEPLYSTVVWWSWVLMLPILIGVMIVIYFHEENDEIKIDKILE